MTVGMYERVNEAWYLRLLERMRINTVMGETARGYPKEWREGDVGAYGHAT